MESKPDVFYGYLEEGVYGEFRHVPEPSPNKNKIGFIFGSKRYEFSCLAEPDKNKPESQEDMWNEIEKKYIDFHEPKLDISELMNHFKLIRINV